MLVVPFILVEVRRLLKLLLVLVSLRFVDLLVVIFEDFICNRVDAEDVAADHEEVDAADVFSDFGLSTDWQTLPEVVEIAILLLVDLIAAIILVVVLVQSLPDLIESEEKAHAIHDRNESLALLIPQIEQLRQVLF